MVGIPLGGECRGGGGRGFGSGGWGRGIRVCGSTHVRLDCDALVIVDKARLVPKAFRIDIEARSSPFRWLSRRVLSRAGGLGLRRPVRMLLALVVYEELEEIFGTVPLLLRLDQTGVISDEAPARDLARGEEPKGGAPPGAPTASPPPGPPPPSTRTRKGATLICGTRARRSAVGFAAARADARRRIELSWCRRPSLYPSLYSSLYPSLYPSSPHPWW